MKPRLGLVSAGPAVSRPVLARIPLLAERLGPVVGPNLRLSGRTVRELRAGHPARGYEALRPARTVLIAVSDAELPATVEELAETDAGWERKIVLLCDSSFESGALAPLAERGAATASWSAVEGVEEAGVVAEGARAALREVRALLNEKRIPVHELRHGCKLHYMAAMSFCTGLFAPLVDASVRCLREAGLKPGPAAAVAEQLFQRTLRAYLHGGRKTRVSRLTLEHRAAIDRQIAALQRTHPAVSHLFRRNLASALEMMQGRR